MGIAIFVYGEGRDESKRREEAMRQRGKEAKGTERDRKGQKETERDRKRVRYQPLSAASLMSLNSLISLVRDHACPSYLLAPLSSPNK